MAYAKLHNFVVLTHDLDFGDMLAVTGAVGPSVAQIRSSDLRVEVIFKPVTDAIAAAAGDLSRGALLSIDLRRARARVRLLPLPRSS